VSAIEIPPVPPGPEPASEPVLVVRAEGRAASRWYRQPALVAGLAILAVVVGLALAGAADHLVQPHYPEPQRVVARAEQGPSARHRPAGPRHVHPAALRAAARPAHRVHRRALPFVLGIVLGSLAGYFGGWVDTTIMRLVDIVVAFPFYVLIIALVFVLGPGERSIYLAITVVGWVAYARIIRGEILVAKRQDYVTAARSGGLSNVRIMRRHLLPNVISQGYIYAMSDIVQDILAIVTLGYLGLGIPPPTADLGSMINDGQNFLSTHWQLTTIPGLVVVVVGLGLSLTGDGLADLLRPGHDGNRECLDSGGP
jgi:peptide/nickel transport system permease protein